jgi:hypothetical protein
MLNTPTLIRTLAVTAGIALPLGAQSPRLDENS